MKWPKLGVVQSDIRILRADPSGARRRMEDRIRDDRRDVREQCHVVGQ